MKKRLLSSYEKVLGFAVMTCLALVMNGFLPGNGYAKTAQEIEASVDVALEQFYNDVDGARKFAESAKGILVLPRVIKGAFIIGGEYGEGALRIDGQTVDYYNMAAGSFGLQIGGQSKNFIIMFMTQKALDSFRTSEGWEAGVDGNVVLIDMGGGKGLSTYTGKDPVVGFVFGAKGLIADLSLKGAKFTRLKK